MTPWRTYADPATLDPDRSAKDLNRAGRALRSELPYSDALSTSIDENSRVTGIVVPLVASSPLWPVQDANGRVVFDMADVDDSLPGPWEWDVVRLAAGIGKGSAVVAFAGGYQRGVAAMADEPLHAAHARATAVSAGLARGREGASAAAAARLLVKDGPAPRLRPEALARRWDTAVAAPVTDIARELAQYRETVAEPHATVLAHYGVSEAFAAEDGRLMVLLARGRGDVLLLEATPVGPSPLEAMAGAWRAGSDVQRVLLARETIPLVSQEMLGWSTSPDGAVARVWGRARALPRRSDAEAGGRRGRARALGVVVGLVHGAGGDANTLSGYVGRSDRFAKALADAVG